MNWLLWTVSPRRKRLPFFCPLWICADLLRCSWKTWCKRSKVFAAQSSALCIIHLLYSQPPQQLIYEWGWDDLEPQEDTAAQTFLVQDLPLLAFYSLGLVFWNKCSFWAYKIHVLYVTAIAIEAKTLPSGGPPFSLISEKLCTVSGEKQIHFFIMPWNFATQESQCLSWNSKSIKDCENN